MYIKKKLGRCCVATPYTKEGQKGNDPACSMSLQNGNKQKPNEPITSGSQEAERRLPTTSSSQKVCLGWSQSGGRGNRTQPCNHCRMYKAQPQRNPSPLARCALVPARADRSCGKAAKSDRLRACCRNLHPEPSRLRYDGGKVSLALGTNG